MDEFAALKRVPRVSLSWARDAQSIKGADLLVLPGSKHVAEDLHWLRQTGLDAAIAAHVTSRKPTLAICGGLQMLGQELLDPYGVEGAADGLNLLALSTGFQSAKRYRQGTYAFGALSGFWAPLSHVEFNAYEIRNGQLSRHPSAAGARSVYSVLPDDCGWQSGDILALYTHGLFENTSVLRALFGAQVPTLDDTLDGLQYFAGEHIGAHASASLVE